MRAPRNAQCGTSEPSRACWAGGARRIARRCADGTRSFQDRAETTRPRPARSDAPCEPGLDGVASRGTAWDNAPRDGTTSLHGTDDLQERCQVRHGRDFIPVAPREQRPPHGSKLLQHGIVRPVLLAVAVAGHERPLGVLPHHGHHAGRLRAQDARETARLERRHLGGSVGRRHRGSTRVLVWHQRTSKPRPSDNKSSVAGAASPRAATEFLGGICRNEG